MPPGSVHTANSISIAALLAGAAYFYDPTFVSNKDSIDLVVGALSGVLLSPDLDVDSGYIGLMFLRKIPLIGKIISKLWQWFWKPYALLVPHRSWISHFPVISTTIRVFILFVFFGLPLIFFHEEVFMHNFRAFFVWFIGLCISDTFHFFADWFSGELNRFSGKNE